MNILTLLTHPVSFQTLFLCGTQNKTFWRTQLHWNPLTSTLRTKLPNIFFYVPQKKDIWVWNDLRVSKWWQHCVFGWTITLRINFVSDASPNISKNESFIDKEEEHREIKWIRLDLMRNICIHAEFFWMVSCQIGAQSETVWVIFCNMWEYLSGFPQEKHLRTGKLHLLKPLRFESDPLWFFFWKLRLPTLTQHALWLTNKAAKTKRADKVKVNTGMLEREHQSPQTTIWVVYSSW